VLVVSQSVTVLVSHTTGSEQGLTIVADIVKLFTSAVGVISQATLLRKTVTRNNFDLISICFAANFIRSADWLFRGGRSSRGRPVQLGLTSCGIPHLDPGVGVALTSATYQRMQTIWSETRCTTAEDIILGLPRYLTDQYNKANAALGDVSTTCLRDESRLARTTGLLQNLSDPVVYALFALRAAARRNPSSLASSLFTDTFSMGSLAFIQSASTAMAEEIAAFFYTLDDVRQHTSKVLQFYRALDAKPAMPQPAKPVPYRSMESSAPRNEGQLRGVSGLPALHLDGERDRLMC
jgi:ABC-type multidrug transport system fused ATPase/permease subunit